jgi:hypothetical protein
MVYSIVNTSKQLFYETFRTNRNLRIAKQSCKSVERDACGGKQMGEAGLYPAREAVARLSYCEGLEAALMPLQALINIKAPRRGLDGARGKPYSQICRTRSSDDSRWGIGCQISLDLPAREFWSGKQRAELP